MDNNHVILLARLVSEPNFRLEMKNGVESAIEKAGLKVAPEFVEKLEKFIRNEGFENMDSFSINEIHTVFATESGLESKW